MHLDLVQNLAMAAGRGADLEEVAQKLLDSGNFVGPLEGKLHTIVQDLKTGSVTCQVSLMPRSGDYLCILYVYLTSLFVDFVDICWMPHGKTTTS